MTGHRSILFLDSRRTDDTETGERPDYFVDLNLDQIVAAVIAGHDDYGLEPLFLRPLHSADAVVYRQEVARDLEDATLFARIAAFTDAITAMRSELALSAKMRHAPQSQRWHLKAAETYVDAVTRLSGDLMEASIASRGMLSFRDHLGGYVSSPAFLELRGDVHALLETLAGTRYRMEVGGESIRVGRPEAETDYTVDVLATFERFRQGDVVGKVHRTRERSEQMGEFSMRMLRFVARLYPDTFASLAAFLASHRAFLDPTVADFDREVHFYTSYLAYVAPVREAGLAVTYPAVSAASKRVGATRSFDLALAQKLLGDGVPIVCNDISLKGKERILVVTGPNQGGKTTFARMFGQLHYLASLGLPVPGEDVRLFLFDHMYSHFEKEEDLVEGNGKLEDELVRLRDVFAEATPSSIFILNEMFTSTTVEDAVFLGTEVFQRIIALDALCVCVTFIDEFVALSPTAVSMMSGVDEDAGARRTFSIVRRPADGLAYALGIAEKHRLGYVTLKNRLTS